MKNQFHFTFVRFHYVSDRLQQARVFDDSRLCTTPCSLLLALDYSRLVFLQAQKKEMNNAGPTQDPLLVEDPVIDTLVAAKFPERRESMRISAYLQAHKSTIEKEARAGGIHVHPDGVGSQDFWEGIRDRISQLHKENAKTVFGVSFTSPGINSLNPYNELKLLKFTTTPGDVKDITLKDVKRYNYRLARDPEMPMAILNSLSFEGVNFMSDEAFLDAVEGQFSDPFTWKQFAFDLKKEGFLAFTIYDFEGKQPSPKRRKTH